MPSATSTKAPIAMSRHGPSRKKITATAGSDPATSAPEMRRNLRQSVCLRTAHALLTALIMDSPLTMVMPATGPSKIDRTGPPTSPTPRPVMRWKKAPMRMATTMTAATVNTGSYFRRQLRHCLLSGLASHPCIHARYKSDWDNSLFSYRL